ncbi:MAG: tRNA (adenosine(37)-N6)-dimethylallyltransferase MiaA [Ferrovum sp.]|nr:tRNA (adenosine(37)-N6)-dimethylallyltransferase MiaA [Ferrovum sp.]NDU86825.1 tRNA (adenosine(37)-N6)-dimethylallyltransferase MiaA [Ferrovum sp.]
MNAPVIFLLGPTASGKTNLACDLAEHFPLELINVDSASVYRGLDIGTAKPDAQTRARHPHHLMDWVDPDDPYSAARFVADVQLLLPEIRARGRIPLLVGGTPLYFQALQRGLSTLPAAAPDVRAQLEEEARVVGWPALHQRLQEVDPLTAARLAPLDRQRIQRALEVWMVTARPLSSWHAEDSKQGLPGPVLTLGLVPGDRTILHERIAARFHAMVAAGLEQEVMDLRQRYSLHGDLPAMRAVGYRQAWQLLEGELGPSEWVERGIIATRQLAKRQLTWLRSWADLQSIDALAQNCAMRAQDLVRRFLAPL